MSTVGNTPRPPCRQQGLTLLETIIAIIVLGFAMAGLASVYPLFQSLDDIEGADRFAREAQGCGELLLAANQLGGEDAFDFDLKQPPCRGDLNQPIDNMTDFLRPGLGGHVDDYCGAKAKKVQVMCRHEGDYTVFKVAREGTDVPPVYIGLPVSD